MGGDTNTQFTVHRQAAEDLKWIDELMEMITDKNSGADFSLPTPSLDGFFLCRSVLYAHSDHLDFA